MYEVLDTAATQLVVRLRAATLEQVFAEAGEAMMSLAVERPELGSQTRTLTFTLSGDDTEELLHEWLVDLIKTQQSQGLLLGDFYVVLSENVLRIQARAEPIDPQRHGRVQQLPPLRRGSVDLARRGGEHVAQVALSR